MIFQGLVFLLFLICGPIVAIVYGVRGYRRSNGSVFRRSLWAFARGGGAFLIALFVMAALDGVVRAINDNLVGSNFDRNLADNVMLAAI